MKPAEHVRLGDIVVADRRGIVQYDNVKTTATAVQSRSHPQKPGAPMMQAASGLDTGAALGNRPWESWIAHGLKTYADAARPSDGSDVLHDGVEVVPHPADPKRRPCHPRVHRGAIASADTLQKNPAQRDMCAIGVADDFDESLDIGRKTRLAGLPGKIHINDPLSVDESPNYQISEHSEPHQIS